MDGANRRTGKGVVERSKRNETAGSGIVTKQREPREHDVKRASIERRKGIKEKKEKETGRKDGYICISNVCTFGRVALVQLLTL